MNFDTSGNSLKNSPAELCPSPTIYILIPHIVYSQSHNDISFLCIYDLYVPVCNVFEVGGGWNLEIETFLGPVKWHQAVRRGPFVRLENINALLPHPSSAVKFSYRTVPLHTLPLQGSKR
jgi:hypothetical protein